MAPTEIDTCLVIDSLGKVAVARFSREVVLSGGLAVDFGEKMAAALRPNQNALLLDFGNVKSLSSLILGKLISLNRKAESLGGRLALCNLQPDIRDIMEVTRLSQLICVYPTEQEALASF